MVAENTRVWLIMFAFEMTVGDHNLTTTQIVKHTLGIVTERVSLVQALVSTNALHDSKMQASWTELTRQSVNVTQDGKGMIVLIVMVIPLVRHTILLQPQRRV